LVPETVLVQPGKGAIGLLPKIYRYLTLPYLALKSFSGDWILNPI